MKSLRLILIAAFLLAASRVISQGSFAYYLPEGQRLNPAIPTPQSVIGFQIGEYHLTYANLVRYMEVLDQASDRITIVKIGATHEKQQLIQLIITSPANQMNLEKLRKDHLASIDPATSQNNSVRKEPLVVWLGYSVHGNEPSGANAAPVVAYYLAACDDEQVVQMLDQTIILLDPCLNPDGFNRFASFVNSRKSLLNNSDPNSFEFQEPWPGGRSNHYWFDLNRDWLLQQHPETQALVAQFHYWRPHLVTDHHEMGSNSTFFFQPGVPKRTNPLIPPRNYSLTQKIGTYHSKTLDLIGSLYYTEESFDDFYFGKGSTYPDLHGSIGILFEQAGSRGHLRQTTNGNLTFPYTIRNQVRVSLSSLEAAFDLRRELQFYMVEFYRTALTESEALPVKGYIFGDPYDPVRNQMMADILIRHQISFQTVEKTVELNGKTFEPGKSFYVPIRQPQSKLIRTLFEKVTEFADSTFYDVSAWNLPLAMGIPFEPVDQKNAGRFAGGRDLITLPEIKGSQAIIQSPVGYLFNCDSYLVHKAIYKILSAGIRVKIATEPFSLEIGQNRINFQQGTILVPTQNQDINPNDLFFILNQVTIENGLTLYPAPTGYSPEGPDLGSGRFISLSLPKILTFSDGGSSTITGEIWHLFDTRFDIPITISDVKRFSSINLADYNTIIITGDNYPGLDNADAEKIRSWVSKGGVLIGIESAGLLNRLELLKLVRKDAATRDDEKPAAPRPYFKKVEDQAGKGIPGSIFLAGLDTTHPLGYGYHTSQVTVFKENTDFYKISDDPYENPLIFTNDPLLSGYINSENLGKLRSSSAIQRRSLGNGKVIVFLDDPLFRGYWSGMHKLFLNSVFWGKI